MSAETTTLAAPDTNRLALRPREAAAALGISPRTLWLLTNQNAIPHVRIGRALLYPTDLLRSWLTERAEGSSDAK